MKHLFVFCLLNVFLLLASAAYAQVGIGTTTPHPSAQLEIVAPQKGLLIPRMGLTERTGIATPATGLMIYQTDNDPGFYYFDGIAWAKVGAIKNPAGFSAVGNSTPAFVPSTGRIQIPWTQIYTSVGFLNIPASSFTVGENGFYKLSADITYDAESGTGNLPSNSNPYIAIRNASTSQVYAKTKFPVTDIVIPPSSKLRSIPSAGTLHIEGTSFLNAGDGIGLYYDQSASGMSFSVNSVDGPPFAHWSVLKIAE